MKRILLLLAVAFQLACTASPKKPEALPIETSEITYKADGKKMVGFIAKPKNITGPLPAVIVVHEWWGQDDYARKRAEMLAELGYIALAVDMFGERKIADHPKTAAEFASAAGKNAKTVAARFNPALKILKTHKDVDPKKVAAIGYCFGGSVVLEMAKQGADLKAVASFHGGLKTDTEPKTGKIKAKIAVHNGAEDPMVSAEAIKAFEEGMTKAKAQYTFTNYPGAKHAFTNPQATANGEKFQLPLAYNPKADKESWAALQQLLKESFQ